MDIQRLLAETGIVFWWTFVGVVAFIAGSWLFDKLDPVDYRTEIQKGNVAAAIKMSAVLLGLAGIIIMVIR